jgi:uncharacterized protein
MSQHLMLIPSLSCPASCSYCFGPQDGGQPMPQETVEAIVRWQNEFEAGDTLEITFHGGEPLLPGAGFYHMALPLLRDQLSSRQVGFAMQSNLWLLTDELCDLFCEYEVSIGTSLDGPEHVNDDQRGEGYFRRTMAGIERARKHGISVGCICTFTAQSAAHIEETFDFFVREGLDFSIHAALPSVQHPKANGRTLSPEAHGELLVEMLDRYLASLDKVRINTLDALCRSVSSGRGGICTFGDCLGEYLAIGPEGRIYPCQRFGGMPEYQLGNVHHCPSLEMLSASPVWQAFRDRQERTAGECGTCPHVDFCRGGCPYNVLAANGGSFGQDLRDPHCLAYRRIFSHITDRALSEVFSEENLADVVVQGPGEFGLLHKGKLLQIMRGGAHPHALAQQARRIAGAVALAVSGSSDEAMRKLDRAGLVTRPDRAAHSLVALQEYLRGQSQGLVNAYIHVTHTCNLACDHCYASSGPHRGDRVMMVEDVARLVHEAASAGFGKAVITGGEPLMHPERHALLNMLAELRHSVKPLETTLRTNLVFPMTTDLVSRLAHSTDQVVVSVDGDEASHDARRGPGTYAHTVENLRTLLTSAPSTQVGIAAALTAEQIHGQEGDALRSLAEELGVAARCKPILPIGRAAAMRLTPEFYSSLQDASEIGFHKATISATCGLGMNLYVGTDGECYPCYALTDARYSLGNALGDSLAMILASERYRALKQVTVDSNEKCRRCELRYLCGGYCRAWGSAADPNAPPGDCTALHERARGLLLLALESVEVRVEHWLAAGLPLPPSPPKT